MKNKTRRQAGFTLIEILLAISILVVLIGAVTVVVGNIQEGAKKKVTGIQVKKVKNAIENFKMDMDRYPTDEEKFDVLITKPDDEDEGKKWNGPYLEEKPVDPWNEELEYSIEDVSDDSGVKFKVWSKGPDKDSDTEDDIKSWKESAE